MEASAESILAAVRSGKMETFPQSIVDDMINGVHPIRSFREYRGLTADQLGNAVGISGAYVRQIETGKREGKAQVIKAISDALNVDMELLIED